MAESKEKDIPQQLHNDYKVLVIGGNGYKYPFFDTGIQILGDDNVINSALTAHAELKSNDMSSILYWQSVDEYLSENIGNIAGYNGIKGKFAFVLIDDNAITGILNGCDDEAIEFIANMIKKYTVRITKKHRRVNDAVNNPDNNSLVFARIHDTNTIIGKNDSGRKYVPQFINRFHYFMLHSNNGQSNIASVLATKNHSVNSYYAVHKVYSGSHLLYNTDGARYFSQPNDFNFERLEEKINGDALNKNYYDTIVKKHESDRIPFTGSIIEFIYYAMSSIGMFGNTNPRVEKRVVTNTQFSPKKIVFALPPSDEDESSGADNVVWADRAAVNSNVLGDKRLQLEDQRKNMRLAEESQQEERDREERERKQRVLNFERQREELERKELEGEEREREERRQNEPIYLENQRRSNVERQQRATTDQKRDARRTEEREREEREREEREREEREREERERERRQNEFADLEAHRKLDFERRQRAKEREQEELAIETHRRNTIGKTFKSWNSRTKANLRQRKHENELEEQQQLSGEERATIQHEIRLYSSIINTLQNYF